MFSTLRQGDTVLVLEQLDKLTLNTGEIIEILPTYTPNYNYNGNINMKVKINDQEYEFKKVPWNQSVAKNGKIVIGENKEVILKEVSALKENSEQILNNIDYHKQLVRDCDAILRENDTYYNSTVKHDEEINDLRNQINDMSKSLAKIEKLLSSQNKD